ncbi:hypothetical protein [Gordonia polyisoprenivorans]|uniref:hypothetical protein n=1 Tax=Gordonia polyisoprenivorans TaxID=84595 RepID=UPI001AD60643|nr:hypothetical protein [Gordonia polyisoprenivorans]QTI66869.1 hypothetical protein J6U32_14440 [Gordonia polyisoprenivorans]
MKATKARRDRFATAIHEAAHAVIATIYGGEISSAVLTPDDPDSGGRVTYKTTFTDQRRADICFAGPYAEAFARHGGPPTSRGLRLQLDRHAFDARAIRESGDHSGQVPRLVANCWGSITGLAHQLYTDGKISQPDVDRALFLPLDDADARSFALANIRSGATPGTFGITPAGVRA